MDSLYSMLALDEAEQTPGKSGTPRVVLTDQLDLQETRSSVWYISPGQQTTYHTQATQEELYFQIQGPGQIQLGDELITVPERSVIKVPPPTPRRLFNESNQQHVWLVVGAPPVENDGRPIQ